MFLFEVLSVAHFAYLVPALLAALCVRHAAKRSGAFGTGMMYMIGTIGHELLHFIVGLLLNAKPIELNLWPEKTEGGYRLGSVVFANIRWYNALFVSMAPLLGLLIVFFYTDYRVTQQSSFRLETNDLLAWLVMAQALLSSWPSSQDFKVALTSWPIIAVAGYVGWARYWPA